MTAGLGSGEETITAATHALVQSLVYTRRKQVSSALALICQLTLRGRTIRCAVNKTNGV